MVGGGGEQQVRKRAKVVVPSAVTGRPRQERRRRSEDGRISNDGHRSRDSSQPMQAREPPHPALATTTAVEHEDEAPNPDAFFSEDAEQPHGGDRRQDHGDHPLQRPMQQHEDFHRRQQASSQQLFAAPLPSVQQPSSSAQYPVNSSIAVPFHGQHTPQHGHDTVQQRQHSDSRGAPEQHQSVATRNNIRLDSARADENSPADHYASERPAAFYHVEHHSHPLQLQHQQHHHGHQHLQHGHQHLQHEHQHLQHEHQHDHPHRHSHPHPHLHHQLQSEQRELVPQHSQGLIASETTAHNHVVPHSDEQVPADTPKQAQPHIGSSTTSSASARSLSRPERLGRTLDATNISSTPATEIPAVMSLPAPASSTLSVSASKPSAAKKGKPRSGGRTRSETQLKDDLSEIKRLRGKKSLTRDQVLDILHVYTMLQTHPKAHSGSGSVRQRVADLLGYSTKTVSSVFQEWHQKRELYAPRPSGNSSAKLTRIPRTRAVVNSVRHFVRMKRARQERVTAVQVRDYLLSIGVLVADRTKSVQLKTALRATQRGLRSMGFRVTGSYDLPDVPAYRSIRSRYMARLALNRVKDAGNRLAEVYVDELHVVFEDPSSSEEAARGGGSNDSNSNSSSSNRKATLRGFVIVYAFQAPRATAYAPTSSSSSSSTAASTPSALQSSRGVVLRDTLAVFDLEPRKVFLPILKETVIPVFPHTPSLLPPQTSHPRSGMGSSHRHQRDVRDEAQHQQPYHPFQSQHPKDDSIAQDSAHGKQQRGPTRIAGEREASSEFHVDRPAAAPLAESLSDADGRHSHQISRTASRATHLKGASSSDKMKDSTTPSDVAVLPALNPQGQPQPPPTSAASKSPVSQPLPAPRTGNDASEQVLPVPASQLLTTAPRADVPHAGVALKDGASTHEGSVHEQPTQPFAASEQGRDYEPIGVPFNEKNFTLWYQTRLLPALQQPSLIIMSNAPEHRGYPDGTPDPDAMETHDLRSALTERGVSFKDTADRHELLSKLADHLRNTIKCAVVSLAEALGHSVLWMPPAHSDLHPGDPLCRHVMAAIGCSGCGGYATRQTVMQLKRDVVNCLAVMADPTSLASSVAGDNRTPVESALGEVDMFFAQYEQCGEQQYDEDAEDAKVQEMDYKIEPYEC